MVTIKELQESIDLEKGKLKKAQALTAKDIEKSKLQKELFQLRNRKAISGAGKGKRILQRTGRGLKILGKKAAPILKKQAKLIRDQQLRDDALEKRAAKRKKKSLKKRKSNQGFNIMGDLDF